MKQKKTILMYGTIWQRVAAGETVKYYRNGKWSETGRVQRVIAYTEEYVKFETASCRYCIVFQKYGNGILDAPARVAA